MKFGELLGASLISGWEAHYFDYWKLKEFIKQNTMEREGHKPIFNHQEFVTMFHQEERRVVLFVNGKLAEIVNELEFQTTRYADYNRAACQELGTKVIKFDRFINDAWNAQQKILKKYRKWTHQQTAAWFDERNCPLSRAQNVVHALVVALSSLSERQWSAADSDWVPPDSFVRKTVKYWVRPEHATATKLFMIQQLPILEINKTPFPPPSLDGEKHSQIHNFLSSVYMDNDAADCYHRRIAMEEGANLLRVRWYGGEAGPDGLPRPSSGTIFFMELKTHHNPDQSGLKSTKERFPITAQMIPGFMNGKLSADQVVDAMVAQGHIKSAKETEQKELATFIQKLILSLKLKPWIRTVYHRTAFQRSDSNEVRVSFDLPLILHPELPNWDGKNWMDLFKVNNSNATPFGYGVLEVKTSDEPPAWVEELIATGWLIKVEKFSKFQHATATFHNEAVRVLPYWINSDITKQIDQELPENTSQLVQKTTKPRNSNISNGSAEGAPPASPQKQLFIGVRSQPSTSAPGSPVTHGEDSLFLPLLSINQEGEDRGGPRSRASLRSTVLDGAKSPLKRERDAGFPPPPPPVIMAPPAARGTNLTRMRVEPKVFFANERTFLKWMFAVVILISVSMTVMSISDRSVPYGISLLATACILIIYAVGLYRWRLTKILKREGTRFDDRIGPFLIAFCLLAASCVVFVFAWTSGEEKTFVCQRTIPPYAPIAPDPDVTIVTVYSTQSLDLSNTVARVQACITTEEQDPADGSGSSSQSKKAKAAKPTVVWDVNNTFLVPSTNIDQPEAAYLRYEADLKQLTFNIRNDSEYFNVLVAHANNSVGVVVYAARAVAGSVLYYAEVSMQGVAAPPTSAMQINTIFNVPFFNASITLKQEWELRSRYTFANVQFADIKAQVTILPQFVAIDDRALQTNAVNVIVSVEMKRLTDEAFSYSSLRQAQSFIEALYKADESHEVLKAQWKR